MLSLVCFFVCCLLLLSSGCVFAAARFGLRFEEALPLSLTAVMLLLFGFGLVGLLAVGVYALCAAALLLYALSLKLAAGRYGELRSLLFTPGALLFLLSFAALFALNYGRQVWRIDEMTHWADTVKAMYYTGLLPSAKAAATNMPSYPPGMALMEYLFLRLHLLFDPEGGYTEWVMYPAFQCYLLSFSFPFLRSLDFKKPLRLLLAAALVFLCPLMMDESQPYSSLYIDPFLCAALGGGLAAVFFETRKDRPRYELYVFSACAALVLAKPAGLLLAFFVAAVYAAELLLRERNFGRCRGRLLGAAAAVFLPLGLWSLRKAYDGVTQSFSSKEGAVDLRMALRCALHREGENWQQLVHDDYYHRLFTDTVRIKGLACPYWLLLLLSIAAIYALLRLTERRCPSLRSARRIAVPSLVLIAVVYYVGMCYAYIFKFGWWEAVVLASFARYVGIVLYAVYTAATLCFVRYLTETDESPRALCAALAVFALLSPFGRALEVLKRTDIAPEIPLYAEYRALADELRARTDGGAARVAIICQASNLAGDSYGIRYLLRPNTTGPSELWFLGPSPGRDWEEIADRFLSAGDWLRELRENYDYLYLMHADDYFLAQYASLFAPDSAPVDRGLYRVGETLRLVLVNEA